MLVRYSSPDYSHICLSLFSFSLFLFSKNMWTSNDPSNIKSKEEYDAVQDNWGMVHLGYKSHKQAKGRPRPSLQNAQRHAMECNATLGSICSKYNKNKVNHQTPRANSGSPLVCPPWKYRRGHYHAFWHSWVHVSAISPRDPGQIHHWYPANGPAAGSNILMNSKIRAVCRLFGSLKPLSWAG